MTTQVAESYFEAGVRVGQEDAAVYLENRACYYRRCAARELDKFNQGGLAAAYLQLADTFDRAAMHVRHPGSLQKRDDVKVLDEEAEDASNYESSTTYKRLKSYEFFKAAR